MKIKDQIQQELFFNKTPNRIISLVPSQTELLVNLGLENRLVGITKFCVHPKGLLKRKEIIGGTKQINVDKIKALKPDFIICNKEENTKEIVQICSEITPTYVSDIYTIADTIDFINDIGLILDCKTSAKKMTNTILKSYTKFRQFTQNKSKLKVVYFIWANPYMVVGGNNFIDHILQINNFYNVYKNRNRYPQIELKFLPKIDLVLLSSEPFPFKEKHALEIKKYTNAKIHFVDGEMFSWFGSRLLLSFNYFKNLRKSLDLI